MMVSSLLLYIKLDANNSMHRRFLPKILLQAFLWCSMLAKPFSGWLVSVFRMLFGVIVGKLLCRQLEIVIRTSPVLGIGWNYLHWLTPLAGALGEAAKIFQLKIFC